MTTQGKNAKKTMTSPKTIGIPVNQINEGLRLCASNIRRFINDIRILLKDSSDWHAIALAIFAFEELAKYSKLKKAKESAGDTVMVDEHLFGKSRNRHSYKQDIARKLIQQETTTLISSCFGSAYFDSSYFDTESVEVSPTLRLDCVFVD